MVRQREPRRRSSACALLAVCGVLAISALPALMGCGTEDPQTIVIDLQPWGMDFHTDEGEHFMLLVERAFYLSVLRFQRVDGLYTLMASIAPPASGGFSPYTVDVGTGAASDVMFVTDITEGSPRLLAVRPSYSGDVSLDTLLLAETGGPLPEAFADLQGVASLHVGGDTYRVFLADDNQVRILDYRVADKTFSYGNPAYPSITGGCGIAFRSPVGLAVDGAADPLTNLPALYVVDKGRNTLFRFSGIGGAAPQAACDGFLTEWDSGSEYFQDPRGVAVLSGGDVPAEARVVVADSRKTPSGNDRVTAFSWAPLAGSFQEESLPNRFEFFPNAPPFALGFDENDDLWATYPEAKAIAGPPRTLD